MRLPLTRPSWRQLSIAALVLAPMLFNAYLLWPELSTGLPSVNDNANHFLFVQRANEALGRGENVFDHWVPQMELGFPEFFYYQHLPHLVVVALHRVLFGLVDLLTLFNLVRYVLLVGLPLTVFWSMRHLDFSVRASAFGAAASPLISANHLFGLEYESFVWRGFGLYTQLWAVHLSFITLAALRRLMTSGSGYALAIIAFSALALSHLAYAYMAAISALVMVAVGLNRANLKARALRLLMVALPTGLIASYLAIPFVLEREYLYVSPGLPRFRFDSFGAQQVMEWLVRGELFDFGRLPVLTLLLAVGVAVAAVRRRGPELLALALFFTWLVLYFGRASLGPLADLLPFREGLPMHRFIGSVQIAGVLLIGIAGAWLWGLPAMLANWRDSRLPGAARRVLTLIAPVPLVALLLIPAFGERAGFLGLNRIWMDQVDVALARDRDIARVLHAITDLAPGRVYAGLRSNWGERMLDLGLPFRSLRVYDLVTFRALSPVGPPYYSWSLNSDLLFDFNDGDPAQYGVLNVRHVVAPTGLSPQSFWTEPRAFGPYTLYSVGTGGYASFVGISERRGVPSQASLMEQNRLWLASANPALGRVVRWDFPAEPASSAVGGERCADGLVREDRIAPDLFQFTVRCSAPAVLQIKTTYHPNWQVTVDGIVRPTFMLSPSYIGVEVLPGEHIVVAKYNSGALKTPLLLLGSLAALATIAGRRRFVDLESLLIQEDQNHQNK